MNQMQNPLFKEPIGMTFKIRREQLGMSLDDVAKNLKFGAHLVSAIELEQWESLGPPIYANSYINSYIKLLGLNSEIRNEIPRFKSDSALKAVVTPRLTPSSSLPKAFLAIFIVCGLVAIIAFVYSRNQPAEELTPSLANSISAEIPNATMMAKNPLTQPKAEAKAAPLPAQASAIPLAGNTSTLKEISVRTQTEAWMEIRDSNNAVVFNELIPANEDRKQSIDKVGKITLGSASKVVLSINGNVQDLSPFAISDVARFTIDQDGKATAISK